MRTLNGNSSGDVSPPDETSVVDAVVPQVGPVAGASGVIADVVGVAALPVAIGAILASTVLTGFDCPLLVVSIDPMLVIEEVPAIIVFCAVSLAIGATAVTAYGVAVIALLTCLHGTVAATWCSRRVDTAGLR